MPAKSIRVALLTHGGGAHVGSYLQALAASEHCNEVVLGDPDGRWSKDATRVLKDKLKAVERDYRTLLEKTRPKMALVTMEAALAPPVIELALGFDCHVFAEKPACVNAADFAMLKQQADARDRHLMLALANRTNPEIMAAKAMVAERRIGQVYSVEMHLIADQTRLTKPQYHRQWFAAKARAGGGHLIWLGIHWLDLAMYVSGSSIRNVSGFIDNVGGQPIDVEDAAVAALRFDNGSLGTITSGYFLDRGYNSHIKIWGSKGWLHLESMKDEPLHWYESSGEKKGVVQTWKGSKQPRGYTPFVKQAVAACAGLGKPPIDNADSLRALQTVYAIYSAAQAKSTVKVA